MGGAPFWLRWSLRDLRTRWPLIVAIGLLLAGGTGLAAGLASMRDWRVDSNDASYAALAVHDLRIAAEEGSFAPQGALARAAREIPDARAVAATSERLIVPTQIDASGAGEGAVITPGQLVGVEPGRVRRVDGVAVTGPEVDAISVERGEGLPAAPGAQGSPPAAILHAQYAKENGIEPGARVRLPGGPVQVAGIGVSPETFLAVGPGGSFGAAADFGSLFVPLAVAQELAGRSGRVNDLAVTLAPGADRARIAAQLERRIRADLPGLGIRVSTPEEMDSYRVLYDDAENDQQLFNVFAFLILAGAAFGAFNLINRTIEAQRRETGIGMALGVAPARLAIRPLLMGLQIAIIGVLLGAGVGLLVAEWLRGVLVDQLPLPIVETDLRPGSFGTRAAIGFVIPLLAAAWPLWRGLRVTPIEAIRVGFRASRGGGLAPLLARLPLPGGSLAQMAPRNVLRAPRRTALTVLASGAVIAVAVSMSGMLDSFRETVDRNSAEELRMAPDRLDVTLEGHPRLDGPELARVTGSPAAGRAETRLAVPARLRSEGEEFDVEVSTIAATGERVWAPRVASGRLPRGAREILIAESAAADLGVGPGDELTLVHPRRVGADRFTTARTTVRVSGTHPDPFRFPTFMRPEAAEAFGLAGRANQVDVVPAAGVGDAEAKRALLRVPGVATIEPASRLSQSLEEGLDEFGAIIRVVVVIAVVLVLLIAFNSTAINADERAREHATMLAYGLRPHTVLRLAVVESLIIGVLATALGIALGALILGWVVNVSLKEVLPELGAVTTLSAQSILLAALAGAGAMAAAPLLTIRRLRRMDVPSTLRVVE